MRLVTVYLPEGHIKILDNLVSAGQYPNRSEAIRAAVHDLVVSEGSLS